MVCGNVFHLILTCNPNGELVKYAKSENSFVFLLPPEADDQSLAMTGSFSTMLLSGILAARIHEVNKLKGQIDLLSQYGSTILNTYLDDLRKPAELNFDRAVFRKSSR